MVSRFNGVNENGTEASGIYPLDATRDSFFGNTELFGDLENITPIFKLTGLNPAIAYDLKLYASRMGVGYNRETHYTVTGATEATADLNIANNETESALITGLKPSASGEITIALTPGVNNDNANHFVYLGILQMDWTESAPSAPPTLSEAKYSNGVFSFKLTGTTGKTYQIQRTRTFVGAWENAQTVTLASASQTVQVTQAESEYFYRAVEQ
jgi:hypothetical protein